MKNSNESITLHPDPSKIVEINLDQLILDKENPRLAWKVDDGSQETLIKVLWTEMSVDEVAFSIAANGYFKSEPLLVIPSTTGEKGSIKQKFIVVEGNRRLAAVLLLRNINIRQRVKATDLPEISETRWSELGRLPAIIYPGRKSLWEALGFLHINGIKPWDSFSKAKYISDVHDNYKIELNEIARRIGDRHSTVKRLYRGYKLLEQAEAQTGFDKEDQVQNRFFFSHLYTAADQKEFQTFLGVDADASLKPNPVSKDHLDDLKDHMLWLYGKKSAGIEPKVRSQNPDLNILREVISKSDSLSALRSGYSLERAHNVAEGDEKRFRNSLTSSKLELQYAKATVVTGYIGDEYLISTIKDILLLAESIEDEMERIYQEVNSQMGKRTKRSRRG